MENKNPERNKPADRHLDIPSEANRDKHINFVALENGDADPVDDRSIGPLAEKSIDQTNNPEPKRKRKRIPLNFKRVFMAGKKRNRNSEKGSENENRTGAPEPGYKKLKDNPNQSTDDVSTQGDTSDPKYSRTGLRKDEKERRR
jgi:hypothetical protein